MPELEKNTEFILARKMETSPENREKSEDVEAKKNAALERAEILSREIKSSGKQMQNILINIQQVTQAVSDLLKQMNIKDEEDPDSVRRDKEFLEKLKNKIQKHREELLKMKNDLVREKTRQIAGSGAALSGPEIEEKANKEVEEMIKQVLS